MRGEANVERLLILPLLSALGYDANDIDSQYPVEFQKGLLARKPEADIVCFWGPLHNRDTSLVVVEAKKTGKALPDGKKQGESYAANLRAPLLLLTNGEVLEIWQLQTTQESVHLIKVRTDDGRKRAKANGTNSAGRNVKRPAYWRGANLGLYQTIVDASDQSQTRK